MNKCLKKAVDISLIFKLLLFFFLSVLIVKLAVSFLKIIFELFQKTSELKTIKNLEDKVSYLLQKDPGSVLKGQINAGKNVNLICFTRPRDLSESLGFNWNYNNIKNIYPSFNFDGDIKSLSEYNQKNVFFIYNDGSYKAFLIKSLYSSFFDSNPLCFKNGENYYLFNYKNFIIISKKAFEMD
jgi:hypothetical protein